MSLERVRVAGCYCNEAVYIGGVKPVTVAAFNSPEEAESLRMRLTEAGIPAWVFRESVTEDLIDSARLSAGVRVEVPRQEFEAALKLVYDWNAESEGRPLISPQPPLNPPATSPDRPHPRNQG